ncbi:CENP-C_C domain-containing protein [Trichonephila clavata]|uniref:CENP-C_C domain-containing protein n=1 Tax=Trichonephila clavata TaxID=2740835 RepID=A0A8X6HRG9_TRICU|nr:CENP-C_C domain-containing protein [Trichonephila clavata]
MEGRKRKHDSGTETSSSKRSRPSTDWPDTIPVISWTQNLEDPTPSTSGGIRHRIEKFVRGKKEEAQTFDDNGTDSTSGNSPPDSRAREWTSSTYSGGVKTLKRVKRKQFSGTPSPNTTGRTGTSKPDTLSSTPENTSSDKTSLKRKRRPSESEKISRKTRRPTDDWNLEEGREPPSINRGRRPKERGLSRNKSGSNICPGSSKSSNGNISGPATGLRRSTRYRVPPLEAWRSERLIFKLENGEIECLGIDRGTAADNSGIAQMQRKIRRIQNNKTKAIERSRSVRSILTQVRNTQTGRFVQARVHRPFQSLEWSNSPDQVRPPHYTLTKAFSSSSICFGFIEINPFCTTGTSVSQTENIHICIIKGHLEVTVEERKFIFNRGDSCIVPFGVPYLITNCSNTKAQIAFCHFLQPIFPHQNRT